MVIVNLCFNKYTTGKSYWLCLQLRCLQFERRHRFSTLIQRLYQKYPSELVLTRLGDSMLLKMFFSFCWVWKSKDGLRVDLLRRWVSSNFHSGEYLGAQKKFEIWMSFSYRFDEYVKLNIVLVKQNINSSFSNGFVVVIDGQATGNDYSVASFPSWRRQRLQKVLLALYSTEEETTKSGNEQIEIRKFIFSMFNRSFDNVTALIGDSGCIKSWVVT